MLSFSTAMKTEKLKIEWEDVGKLEISIDGNRSATISYMPSESVIREHLAKASKKPSNKSPDKATNFTHDL